MKPRTIGSHTFDLKDVQVLDTTGKKVDKKDLAKLLKKETVAMASFGGRELDPLHLRVLKEGTLVFILPNHKLGAFPPGFQPLPNGAPPLPGNVIPQPGPAASPIPREGARQGDTPPSNK